MEVTTGCLWTSVSLEKTKVKSEMPKKYWMVGLSLGLIVGAIAACTPSTSPPTGSGTDTQGSPAPQTTEPVAGRSAYSEVSLPPEEKLVGDDPQQIALAAFGMTAPTEGNFKEEVTVVEQTASQAVVVLTQTGLPDDSVEGMRYRMEFIPEGTQWRLDWAGRQVRCRPNRGSQEWTTELCS